MKSLQTKMVDTNKVLQPLIPISKPLWSSVMGRRGLKQRVGDPYYRLAIMIMIMMMHHHLKHL